jgi:asparagine synthase (glutamine-hydrolysing)
MCGITGFIDHNHIINESIFKQASSAISHRGGNGSGSIFEEKEHFSLGIATERLATIDLSAKSQQPLTSNCGSYSITFNGTISNYLELREALIKYGVIFSTLSDTEVILESYKKWGNKAFEKLDGSYSFAILDRKLKQLLIARDEIGAKPIYYYKKKGFYAFSSEIRALLKFPLIEKKINKTALANYFRYGYFTGEQTIYQDILRFKKGTITTIDIHSGNSYDIPILRPQISVDASLNNNEEDILKKIEELLTESILKRNVADVPVGTLLSGGYDSATVAAILQKNQSKRIKTFTVGFKDEKLDEAPQARKIAAHLKTNHEEFYLDKDEALKIVKELPEIFDEPAGDSGAIPLAFIAKKINKDIKVLLGAEGGDELFGGYRTYAKAIKLNAFKDSKIPKIIKDAITAILKSTQPQMKEILAAEDLLNKYLAISACYTLKEIDLLLKSEANPEESKKNNVITIKGLLVYDLHNYLPNNILFKNDHCFAHFGMDNRDAILKTELVDYLTTLDPKWFIKDGQQKYLLKKITHKYIPANLMNKPKKGFVIPLASWLKTAFKPLVEKYLAPEMLNQHQLFDVKEVAKIKTAFYINSNTYNAQRVWLLLQFQMWYERWMKELEVGS